MTQFFKANKTLILGGVLVIAAAFVYFNFFSSGSGGAVVTTSATPSPVSQELLLSLTTLYTIKLDTALFKSPVFLSLSDFGVQIPQEAIGRRNPFAPVGTQ